MVGKVIKIKSEGNYALRKLVNDLDTAELMMNQQQQINDDDQDEKWSPERWYAELRKRWYFHDSSWYMRQALSAEKLSEEEMKIGCNGFTGCIEGCRFFPEEGRVEEGEIQRIIQTLSALVEFKKKPCTKQEDKK
jgi:hypothetical protein